MDISNTENETIGSSEALNEKLNPFFDNWKSPKKSSLLLQSSGIFLSDQAEYQARNEVDMERGSYSLV